MSSMGYLGAFLFGAGAGFLAAGTVSGMILRRRTGGLGELVLPLMLLILGAVATLAGGLLGVFVLSLWRGEALTGLLICASVVAVLFLATKIRLEANARYERRPEVVRWREEQWELSRRRRAFWEEYSRFLHAAISGDIAVVRSLLDAGMPYVAPSLGVAPRYPLEWTEVTVEAPEIQKAPSIFRYSALELAAWYGHTEMVALLLTRERDTRGERGAQERRQRRERALAYARRYGREETARLLQ